MRRRWIEWWCLACALSCAAEDAPSGPLIQFESFDASLPASAARDAGLSDSGQQQTQAAAPASNGASPDNSPSARSESAGATTHPEGPALAATTVATTVYKQPNKNASRLGYIRLGGIVPRDPDPVTGRDCKGQWYRVHPLGYVCTEEATTELADPLVRAAARRPALDRPLP